MKIGNIEIDSEDKWKEYIKGIVNEAKDKIRSEREAVSLLKKSITKGFDEILPKRFILLFSGGVDSSIIAYVGKSLKREISCICGGFKTSKDIELAKRVADEINLNLETIFFDESEIIDALKEVKRITGKNDVVNIEIGSVFYMTIKAIADKEMFKEQDWICTGLGSEELFIGYKKYIEAENPEKAAIEGLMNGYSNDILRDESIIKNFSKEPLFPFFHQEIIKTALRIPVEYKIKEGIKKYCLREVGLDLGISNEIVETPKRAAQYGSSLSKELGKIARSHGFRNKAEFIKSI